jgi:hypothetical protein
MHCQRRISGLAMDCTLRSGVEFILDVEFIKVCARLGTPLERANYMEIDNALQPAYSLLLPVF